MITGGSLIGSTMPPPVPTPPVGAGGVGGSGGKTGASGTVVGTRGSTVSTALGGRSFSSLASGGGGMSTGGGGGWSLIGSMISRGSGARTKWGAAKAISPITIVPLSASASPMLPGSNLVCRLSAYIACLHQLPGWWPGLLPMLYGDDTTLQKRYKISFCDALVAGLGKGNGRFARRRRVWTSPLREPL